MYVVMSYVSAQKQETTDTFISSNASERNAWPLFVCLESVGCIMCRLIDYWMGFLFCFSYGRQCEKKFSRRDLCHLQMTCELSM